MQSQLKPLHGPYAEPEFLLHHQQAFESDFPPSTMHHAPDQSFPCQPISLPAHIPSSMRSTSLSLHTLNLQDDRNAYTNVPFSAHSSPFVSEATSSPAATLSIDGFNYQESSPATSARDSPSEKSSSSSSDSSSPSTSAPSSAFVDPNEFPQTSRSRESHGGARAASMDSYATEMDSSPPPKAPNQKSNSDTNPKRSRRVWSLALEKYLFTPHEIATLAAPHRRAIYLASLEAHIDRLHSQLFSLKLYTVDIQDLSPYKGLNIKFAKSIVSGLQQDHINARRSLLEVEREIQRIQHDAPARQLHERYGVPAPLLEGLHGETQVHAPALASSRSSH